MAINVSVQRNEGFSRYYTVDPLYYHRGTRLNAVGVYCPARAEIENLSAN